VRLHETCFKKFYDSKRLKNAKMEKFLSKKHHFHHNYSGGPGFSFFKALIRSISISSILAVDSLSLGVSNGVAGVWLLLGVGIAAFALESLKRESSNS
jgi:hypothetical protein